MKLKIKPKQRSKPTLPLQTIRLRNFKAVRDSGTVTFTPLTVFIGNNGSGKSSLVEGLEAFRNIVLHGPDEAFLPWRGFEHVWNQAVSHRLSEDQLGRMAPANPMRFEITGRAGELSMAADVAVTTDTAGNKLVSVPYELFAAPAEETSDGTQEQQIRRVEWRRAVRKWQFLNLEPRLMLDPKPQHRSESVVTLRRDGSNIAQYLQSIADEEPAILQSIAETLKSVLPYAADLRPAITKELQRNVYLRLHEQGIEEPLVGWLLSQGTLRIVALLTVLRHPNPPSVVFVEEIENGLDPRTIHLLVEEIRGFLQNGGQVVATTHSPYLLDLLDLSQIIVVERGKSRAPTFNRPSKKRLKGWAEKFAPGRLYTMGNLTET